MKGILKRIALLLLFIAYPLVADEPFGLVLSIVGDGISVYREGTRVFYGPADVSDDPIILEPDDLIQTEAGATLEIQLLPGTTRLKLPPFTTATLTEEGTGLAVDLVYGRLLADSTSGVTVLSHGTESTVDQDEEAIFGVDYLAERAVGSIPVSLIYGLDGALSVREEGVPSSTRLIEAGSMLRAARVRNRDGNVQLVVETDAIALELVDYWAENPFEGAAFSRQEVVDRYPAVRPRIADWLQSGQIVQAPAAQPAPQETEPQPEPAVSRAPPPTQQEVLNQAIPEALRPEMRTVDYTGTKRFLRGAGITAMSLGLIVEGVGALLYFAAPEVLPQLDTAVAEPLALGLTIGGGAGIGIGILSYIVSNVLGGPDL